jgi:hypothetical protein
MHGSRLFRGLAMSEHMELEAGLGFGLRPQLHSRSLKEDFFSFTHRIYGLAGVKTRRTFFLE